MYRNPNYPDLYAYMYITPYLSCFTQEQDTLVQYVKVIVGHSIQLKICRLSFPSVFTSVIKHSSCNFRPNMYTLLEVQ